MAESGIGTDLRSCAASLQQAAGDLLWAGGCHPLLLRAGRSQDSARLVARCERVLLPGDPLRQTVRESLTNIAGG